MLETTDLVVTASPNVTAHAEPRGARGRRGREPPSNRRTRGRAPRWRHWPGRQRPGSRSDVRPPQSGRVALDGARRARSPGPPRSAGCTWRTSRRTRSTARSGPTWRPREPASAGRWRWRRSAGIGSRVPRPGGPDRAVPAAAGRRGGCPSAADGGRHRRGAPVDRRRTPRCRFLVAADHDSHARPARRHRRRAGPSSI